MANTKQAKKRARQAEKGRERNVSKRSMIRSSVKKVLDMIEEKNLEAAKKTFQEAVSVIDRLSDKGIIHKNKAARHKSRLNKRIKALAGVAAA